MKKILNNMVHRFQKENESKTLNLEQKVSLLKGLLRRIKDANNPKITASKYLGD